MAKGIFRLLGRTDTRLWNCVASKGFCHLSPAGLCRLHTELKKKIIWWIPCGKVAEQAQWKEEGPGCKYVHWSLGVAAGKGGGKPPEERMLSLVLNHSCTQEHNHWTVKLEVSWQLFPCLPLIFPPSQNEHVQRSCPQTSGTKNTGTIHGLQAAYNHLYL